MDFAINATGLKSPTLMARFGPLTGADGSMLVDGHLCAVADPAIHGGGDCIAAQGDELPKIGVFASAPERFTPSAAGS